ncbi:hypothetical protein SLS60_009553 [Paraconiothyrium brasiliense]|uniref:Uncharacterized protein n=1 Tax=Paraconiothyrium brasiliense TaxID=300254 RepID=A0ABR3QV32_9PLEO
MSWSAVVKKASATEEQSSPEKGTAAKNSVPTSEKLAPAEQASPVNASRARMLPMSMSYATAHFSPPIGSLGPRFGEARVGYPPVASSTASHIGHAAPAASIYPVAPRADPGFYRPPQARAETSSLGKVTKPFAKEASAHSNAERYMRAERAAASARATAIAAQASVPAVSGLIPGFQAGQSIGGNNTAMNTNAALPAYGDGPSSTVRRSTVSGNAIVPAVPNFTFAGSRISTAQKRLSSGPPGPSAAIGSERQSGTLVLSNVPQRRLLATTLSLVRSGTANRLRTDRNYESFKEFLDRVCPIGGGVPEPDEWIPSVVVAYWYPMVDHDWMILERVIGHFDLSKQANDFLGSVTATDFDQVNTLFDTAHHFPLKEPVDELIRDLARQYNLDKPNDVNGDKYVPTLWIGGLG